MSAHSEANASVPSSSTSFSLSYDRVSLCLKRTINNPVVCICFSEICDVQKLPGLKKRYIYVTEQGTGPTDSQASPWKQPIHHAWHGPLVNQGQHWSTGKPPSWVGYLFDQRWFHRDVVVHTNYDKNCFHEYTLLSKSLVNKETVFFSKPRYELQHAALQVFLGQPAGHQPSLWLSFSPWPWP